MFNLIESTRHALIQTISQAEISVATNSTTNLNRVNDIPSIPMTTNNSTIRSNTISNAKYQNTLDDFPDDDFLTDIDIDQIALNAVTTPPATTTIQSNHHKTNATNQRSTLLFDDMDDNDFLNIDSNVEQMHESQPEISPITTEMPSRSETTVPHPAAEPMIHADNYRFKIRGLNLVTIKQLNKCSAENRMRREHFIVKAKIDNIAEKARVSKNQWKLNVLLTDQLSHNVTFAVAFATDVLDKLAGVSGREVHAMYTMRNERPQVETEIANILERFGEKLDELHTFMKIKFDATEIRPIVVELIDSAPVLERKLQEKIEFERLK